MRAVDAIIFVRTVCPVVNIDRHHKTRREMGTMAFSGHVMTDSQNIIRNARNVDKNLLREISAQRASRK